MKKKSFFIILLLSSFLLLSLASAELKISKTAVTDTVISEINNPAVFNFQLTNPGSAGNFRIYSLVGIDIFPNETFQIGEGETKNLQVQLKPGNKILETPNTYNFIYKIQSDSGIQEDVITMRVVSLKNALQINSYNIDLDSEKAVIYVKNMVGYNFDNIIASFHSSFFDFGKTFSLNNYEKKEFEIALDSDKIKKLTAGDYIITTDIKTSNANAEIQDSFKFIERAEIKTSETSSGLLIRKQIIEKTNQGNLPFLVQVKINKNIISRLFNSFNIQPSSIERAGFSVTYIFQKEIMPAEVFKVQSTTNWFYPLILILLLIIAGYFVKTYTASNLTLVKKASFVKTKGGEFALKITINVKAKKFIEKINIIDKIPGLVKIYEKFGAIAPNRVDEKNRRLEWHIASLQANEERILSYIIFSKVGVVGKFEIPKATALYERDGKLHESESNQVFFLTEQARKEEY